MTDGHNSGALHTAPLRGLLHHGAANALHLNKRQHPLRNNFLARSIFSNVFDKRTFIEKSPKLLNNATPSNFLRFNSCYSATIVNRNDKHSSWWDRDWRNWVWVSFLRQIKKNFALFFTFDCSSFYNIFQGEIWNSTKLQIYKSIWFWLKWPFGAEAVAEAIRKRFVFW